MWIVTGATGFIGSAMVWELNERGVNNLLLVDHVEPLKRGDLLHKRKYTDFVLADELKGYLGDPTQAGAIEGVIHMGACSTTTETDEAYLERNNVEYSKTLWQFCAKRKKPYIYASSAATYGDGAKGFSDATDSREFKPLNLYGWSKLKFDVWAMEQTAAPPRWHGLRFFNVYGPNEYHKGEQASVVYKAYRQIQETGKLKLFKSHDPKYRDGEQLRDFVYVKDITRWMWELMQKSPIESGVYNMGFGKARTWLDLANATFKSMGKNPQIDWIEIPANIRNQYQYFTEAKMNRALSAGLSRPEWPLERGVADYVDSYLSKPDPYL